jgi:hypothetical protein
MHNGNSTQSGHLLNNPGDTTFANFISIVGLTPLNYNILSVIALILSNSDGYLVHLRRIPGYTREISEQNRQWVNDSTRDMTFFTCNSIVRLTPLIYNIQSVISLILSISDGYLIHLRRIPGYMTEISAQSVREKVSPVGWPLSCLFPLLDSPYSNILYIVQFNQSLQAVVNALYI